MSFAGSLLKAAEEYEGLINGVADFGRTMLYTKSNLYQIASLGMLPYAAKDPVNIYKAITELINKGYAKDDLKGLHFFASTGTPSYAFLFRDNVITSYSIHYTKLYERQTCCFWDGRGPTDCATTLCA